MMMLETLFTYEEQLVGYSQPVKRLLCHYALSCPREKWRLKPSSQTKLK